MRHTRLVVSVSHPVQVYHVDMCTMAFKAKVFGNVPRHVQFQAIGRALTLRSAEPVVSKAVADKDAFGYGLLYVLFLEHSKRKVAKIFSVLSNEANYPLLVNCTHGYAPKPASASQHDRVSY